MSSTDGAVDPLDLASERETIERENALRLVLKNANLKAPHDFDGVNCVDCNLEIPEARLALGKWTCVHCQSLREKRR